MADSYLTIKSEAEGVYREKMSKFISLIFPITSVDEAKSLIKNVQNEYHDARHVCWAYMLGPERKEWQLNDNGEPSGTAGKPILGQINSFGLTNVLIAVVRYFGGIKLGTPGLIAAYREAARAAIENAEIIECHESCNLSILFPYVAINEVMKLAKSDLVEVVSQKFDNTCSMTLSMRKDNEEMVLAKLKTISGVSLAD